MIQSIGKSTFQIVSYVLQICLMVYTSVRATLRDQTQGFRTVVQVVSAQIYFTGFQALPLISVLSLGIGVLVALQFQAQLSFIGQASYLGTMFVVVIAREVAPLLTALLVIARSGTAVASEIGSMRVNKEIEALEVMGINPLSYIVFPRIIGGVISLTCLTFYFTLMAAISAFAVSYLLLEIPLDFFVESLSSAFLVEDLWLFIFKNGLCGIAIFVVCCHQGLLVKQSPHEIPQMTTKGVVNSLIFVCAINLILSGLFYFTQFVQIGIL